MTNPPPKIRLHDVDVSGEPVDPDAVREAVVRAVGALLKDRGPGVGEAGNEVGEAIGQRLAHGSDQG